MERKKKVKRLFIIYTLATFIPIGIIGVLVDNIEAVFNFIGAVCSTSIGILLPCYFYFTLIIKKKKERTYLFYLTIFIFAGTVPLAIFSIVAQYIWLIIQIIMMIDLAKSFLSKKFPFSFDLSELAVQDHVSYGVGHTGLAVPHL